MIPNGRAKHVKCQLKTAQWRCIEVSDDRVCVFVGLNLRGELNGQIRTGELDIRYVR